MENKIVRIKELVELLNNASDAYYNTGNTIMDDKAFDRLLDELKSLEEETGVIMSVSPTQNVGYEVKSKLDKIKHSHPMLSLDKTKSIEDLKKFSNNKDFILSLKMDGLTVLLTYDNGKLIQAETRGNGETGEIITHNARVFENIPLNIDYKGRLEIEGEAVITYDDFRKINSLIENPDDKYKNPRNLVSGSVRQLDSSIAAQRHIKFIAWKVPTDIGINSFRDRLEFVKKLGFDIVPSVTTNDIEHFDFLIENLKNIASEKMFPIDGLVMTYNDIQYGESLGNTGKFPRHSIAYKFYDEVYETELLDIEWTVGRTGTITPIAVFAPVEIDGTTVERASVHNISVLTQLDLHVGDVVEVYKANQIIPQIKRNITAENRYYTDYIIIPPKCPVCGGNTTIKETDNSKILVCTNPDCAAKNLAQFVHLVSRNCLNINNMSEATLERFISLGFLHEYADIYRLKQHRGQLVLLDGFGTKSVDKLLNSIEESRHVKLENFINALGIPNIGLAAAKTISKFCGGDVQKFLNLWGEGFNWETLDDFGEVMAKSIDQYLAHNYHQTVSLIQKLEFEAMEKVEVKDSMFTGKSICVTGKLNHFTRNSINEKIVSLGAKAVSSVSSKTDYLITNEASGSSKYKKAVELNIPIITEDKFLEMIGE